MKRKPKAGHTPRTSVKKQGVTSAFSAATGNPGQYGGEDIGEISGSTGGDADKIAQRNRKSQAEEEPAKQNFRSRNTS